jgi:hypothetical protein
VCKLRSRGEVLLLLKLTKGTAISPSSAKKTGQNDSSSNTRMVCSKQRFKKYIVVCNPEFWVALTNVETPARDFFAARAREEMT